MPPAGSDGRRSVHPPPLILPVLMTLFLLSCLFVAVSASGRRSLGGLHEGSSALAHRAALTRDLATAPTLTPSCTGSGGCNYTHSSAGYWDSCGGAAGNLGEFSRLTPAAAEAECCGKAGCAGFSYGCNDPSCATGSGFFKANVDCGFVPSTSYQGWALTSALPVMPNVSVGVSPSILAGTTSNVTVTFSFTAGTPNRTTDWIAQICEGYDISDYIEFMPIGNIPGWESGRGSFTFTLFHARCNYQFVYYRGRQPLWPSGAAVGVSNVVSWEGLDWAVAPFHTHVAYGGEDTQHAMVVSFTTNSTPTSVTVMVGTSSGVYGWNASAVESTTYGAGDLCNAPANTTSMDYWQWPGVFHHVTLRGLAPATRYYATPVADGVAGEEVTFVTGKELGPDVPISFASYGDMSVTAFVLVGDEQHDTTNGGPGAVGTARRVRERIDTLNDLDFVTHYGDLGYATGAVWLWDAWMSMMSNIASRIPYMVSIGNHEYDYHTPSPNDPSGVSAMWRPTWWDGDVDSRGECGVGTDQRFRGPLNGNRIFWYYFKTGSATVVMLSSEHDLAPDSPQGHFLEATLAGVNRSETPWVIVSQHRQMYSMTHSEQAPMDGFLALVEGPFNRYGVDFVMMGHLHSSQRTCPVFQYKCTSGAPIYLISGSSGAMLEPYPLDDPDNLVQFYHPNSSGLYYIAIENRTHAHLQWVQNSDGGVLDDVWVVRDRA